ncbi:ADP-ribosylglycohydrolase family protein [Streptomyces caniscabiei]|uniref:ADP-ribosylglycohydrolase family protein n=1 Tax=Streptomyces caniscabiei TaxID=2746961 RepID=UPI0029B34318|nr:ADP-ribosylglycohydrolase family protein [Streptomyces caniscabiei]MDX3729086.1 ADP-ribosylglycohydrolase family protein [Streptomyces caniscabiei]
MIPLRLTWVQPEDLLGHELHQARQDGREPSAVAARWRTAGGPPAPLRAGASPTAASPYLRQLAEDLLDELADLPSGLTDDEPTALPGIKAQSPNWPARPTRPTSTTYAPRLEAAWLGRAAGCLLGKPVEKLPLHAIRRLAAVTGNWPLTTWFTARGVPSELLTAHPWNRRSAPTSLAENIDGMPEDDDLNYPLLNLLLLARHGREFTTADVAGLWLDELPAGRTFTAERVAYRNLLTGIEPPRTARHRNPFREWIGALIRADVHGWTNPGDPAAAAEQAHRDATLTHTANGVYAAMFIAATIAEAATGTHDVHQCLRTGLTVVPPNSRLARAITHSLRLTAEIRDFDTVVDELHATYADHHWVHAVPNTALLTAALTHADGDYTASICRAVSGGWDTDSNGATAGSIAGLLAGSPDALPDRWTAPLKNRLATSIADFNGIGFDTLAHLTLRETHRP